MLEKVKARLKALGYEAKDEDSMALSFAISGVCSHIKNFCNVAEVPEAAEQIAVDMACGEFLFGLSQMGKLDETFAIEMALKSVKMGDTDITFADEKSKADKISVLIAALRERAGDLVCFRRLRW